MIRNSKRGLALTTVSLSALMAATLAANASGFALREQSATAQGLSYAGAASGSGGLSSIYWNPATITMKPGWQSEWHASLILPTGDITPLDGTAPVLLPLGPSGDFGQSAIIPSSYTSYQVNDRIWIGLSSSAPFGLATKSGPVWAGQTYARTTKVASFNLNPIVGLKINDWLSIAAGPALQYADLTVRRALAPGLNPPSLSVELDDVDIGFTAGVNITPWAGTSLGVGYRSEIRHDLTGDLTTSLSTVKVPVELRVDTPSMLSVGLSQEIGWGWSIHAGYEWTNWSTLKVPQLVGPAGVLEPFPLNWDDSHFFSLGVEYQVLPQWVLRAGVAYDTTPMSVAERNPRLPDNDRLWASVGVGYKWSDKLTFDLSYSHLFIDKAAINIVPGHQDFQPGLPFVAEAEAQIDIVSFAVKYRWDDVKVAVPAVPVVRKY